MIITVTQEDIDSGVQGDPNSCPIAIAAQRVIGKPVRVRRNTMLVRKDKMSMQIGANYALPQEAQQFILCFDQGWDMVVEPFSFEV